jgi:hypothetical protein
MKIPGPDHPITITPHAGHLAFYPDGVDAIEPIVA